MKTQSRKKFVKSANVNKQNIPLQSNTTMSTSCCLNHRWALLNANLFPIACYRRFGLPQCSELGCHISCDFRALLHSVQTRPNTPWWPSLARSWAGFPHTHNTCCRATPALSHQFTPAAEKESTETPFTPRPVWVPALPSPLSNYLHLNFLHDCLFSIFDKLYFAFTVGNCLLISGKSLHFTPLGSCRGDRAIQPLVIHISTGELTDLMTEVCTVPRSLHFSMLQLHIGKKITTTITIKTQFLLSEEEYSASIQ